ncbi:teichoic acid transport system ATP-binding protein [Mobilisporobacter senegalensis]|uniref:Teichoic acid transport system ATP-binding protein n=1 Tax=Mobilisporobacter senegalensis TaxID=1329262 RepID=A0A3N1Y1S2_9FIRM|nr:ABC transporter ATP-binding protein [Mobilisporobacter senegalensis]ROR31472.1 teichoic acid transport system ATP-binding protein [Mobilisporobacter senegalensis]
MKDVAIKIDDISKIYKLYQKPTDRLKEALGISKKLLYTEHYALKNVSFSIHKGETVGIIGTNGSGKSTLLKIITGVLNASKGNTTVHGRISALLELGAGFNMEYTGIENIYLNGTMIGFTREEIENKLNDIIQFADIGDFINQPVKTYSSGMFVRLAFAVAININPEILIVDEALSVGDVFFQAKCYKKFEEFKERGKTILFVSHDLSSIAKYCDRVILLNRGNLVAEGSAADMIDLYKKVLVNQLDDENQKSDIVKTNMQDQWKNRLIINPNTNSYGNYLAEIIDFGLFDDKGNITNNFIKGRTFTLKMKVKFNAEIQDPIFAFTIKDLRGTEITGTNSMIEKIGVLKTQIDMVKEISFMQKIDLQGGEYLLSLGCTGYRAGDFDVYHRLYDICNITVISDKNTIGYYDMNSIVNIK